MTSTSKRAGSIGEAFPDQENEIVAIHHSDDAVMVEAWIRGTHLGTYRALPPTGRRWELQILAMFLFEEDRLVGERVYVREYRGQLIAAPRVMLHAAELGFVHPANERPMRFQMEPPEDFERLLESLRAD